MILEIALFLVLIGIDLSTKYIICGHLLTLPTQYMTFIDKILNFVYVENYGASFGFLSGKAWILITITLLMVAGMVAFLVMSKKSDRFLRFSLIVVIAGALGNLFDRIFFGYVRDFIEYTFFETWFNFQFAVGNVADVIIIVGVIMLIVYTIFLYKPVETAKSKKGKKNNLNINNIEHPHIVLNEADNKPYINQQGANVGANNTGLPENNVEAYSESNTQNCNVLNDKNTNNKIINKLKKGFEQLALKVKSIFSKNKNAMKINKNEAVNAETMNVGIEINEAVNAEMLKTKNINDVTKNDKNTKDKS